MKKLFFLLLLFTSITAMAQRPASLPYRQTNQVYQGDTTKSILTDTTMLYWTTEPFFDFNKPIRINGKTVSGTDTANYTTNGLMSAYDYRKLQLQTGTGLSNRGYYDASVGTFPSAGGSGSAGAILKGDYWTISVKGTLSGDSVFVGSTITAMFDNPGQTFSNWNILEGGLGYTAENSQNKLTTYNSA